MEYRLLGNTGLKVSVIGMGCEGFAEENYRMTGKMFDAAEELGINYFDLYAADPKVRKAVGEALVALVGHEMRRAPAVGVLTGGVTWHAP